jgi:hypothetical protein
MKRIILHITHTGMLMLTLMLFIKCNQPANMTSAEFNSIQQSFTMPHDTNTVWCYYYWIGDDISKHGVTADMEAMKEFGIGAALIGNINPAEVDGPVPLFSDLWWEIMVHAVNEGHRLGIDVGFFNCPGWSQSGGPWVTYEMAMRHKVFTEARVKGGKRVEVKLEKPSDEFQDTYVLAFQSIDAENKYLNNSNSSVKVQPNISAPSRWLDGNNSSAALFDIRNQNQYIIEIEAQQPISARSIKLFPSTQPFKCNVDLFAWQDGAYKLIRSFLFDRSNTSEQVGPVIYGPLALALPEITSDKFKLVCTNLESPESHAGFSQIKISEAAVFQEYIEKTLGKMDPTPFPEFDAYLWDMQMNVNDKNLLIANSIDISEYMDKDGVVSWDAPEGNWTILRMGMTPTGTRNSPAAPQGKGYEIDKASAELASFHFDQFMGEIIRRIPEESLPALKYVIADSYEMGSQNWTDGFDERFEKKYGYNPIKYLPVFSGRIVGSVEESERFLWDLRRAMADDIAYEYVGGLRKASNKHGLKLWLENYGHWGFPAEFMQYGGQSDLVAGEFWNEGILGNTECKSASSAANMYGKPFTSAEVFTAAWAGYTRHPALLKKRGDWSFTEGINHYVLHLYIHQPDDIRIPGINADFSTEFNRHNTWFKQGKNWVDYARRCQHLLQKGKYVADVMYYIGEDVPKMSGRRNPELPNGYSYDYINAEVILERLTVKDGRFVLPDGLSYSLLVLPDFETMRPNVLAKIEELIKLGGTVMGPKPTHSPSLENYPHADEQIKEIASRLWIDKYEQGKLVHQYKKGYLLDGLDIQEALDLIGVSKDIDLGSDVPVLWIHRAKPGMNIYFLTNQSEEYISFNPVFRVKGLKPQLWDAVTGEIRHLNDYTTDQDGIRVPIKMKPLESWFVVFTNEANDAVNVGFTKNFPDKEIIQQIDSQWIVDFKNKEIGPDEPVSFKTLGSWTESKDSKIKYYSGTATYKTTFEINNIPELGNIVINLGDVGVMAEVKLNGNRLGQRWIKPWDYSVGEFLKQGENILEVEVVNVWRNRMVKDMMLPEDERYTWFIAHDIVAGEELPAAGLLGPVTLQVLK